MSETSTERSWHGRLGALALLLGTASIGIGSPIAGAEAEKRVSEDNAKYVFLRIKVNETAEITAGPDPYKEGEDVYPLDQGLVNPVIISARSR
jgi:hypothetical protein